jgi:hypothetical protein
MFLDKETILQKLDSILENFKDTHYVEFLDEIAMKRVVRHGRVVKIVAVKRRGFKVLRQGNKIKLVRMTNKEKRTRRKGARKAWRKSKSTRKSKAKRSMIKSKVRMKSLYGNRRKR